MVLFEIESSICDAEWNGILKGRFLSELGTCHDVESTPGV